jgi:hypothetical protein
MNRLITAIAMTGVIFASTRALGDESATQPRMGKRHAIAQLVVCMKRRMSHDKGASYNEARKTCKDQIDRQSDNAPSGSLVASATPPKP